MPDVNACWALLTLSVPVAAGRDAPAVVVDLRPSFEEGRELRYVLEQTTATRVGENERVSSMTTDYLFRHRDVTGERARIDITYEAASILVTTGAARLRYDSRTPDAPGMNPRLGRLINVFVGKSLKVNYLPSGEVERLIGLEEIKRAPQAAALADFLDEKTLRRVLWKVVTPSPGKSAATVGEEWPLVEVTDFDETTKLVVTLRLKLAEAAADLATVTVTGEARFDRRENDAGGEPALTLSKQQIRGKVLWDRRRRILRLHELDTLLGLTNRLADGRKVHMVLHQTSRTRLLGDDVK